MVDHRELLKKYIEHVTCCEGTDFLLPRSGSSYGFTEEEWSELIKLSDEQWKNINK